tara:strand:+ start:136 stop:756 length:621 start_codon:yes stop_codon:yes gene_type:complete
MSRKIIITFEGIEGSGKSFHIRNVANFLKKKKINFIKIREPGGSKNSEKIRKIILNNKSNFNKYTDLFLYLAARSENINSLIKKNYKKKVILIDRFTDSTIAYQHYGMGINKNFIKMLNRNLLKNIKIGFTFIHTVNKKNLNYRLLKRKNLNRYDKFNFTFYRNVQNGFINLAKSNKKKYFIVNSDINISKNKKIIIDKIIKILNI